MLPSFEVPKIPEDPVPTRYPHSLIPSTSSRRYSRPHLPSLLWTNDPGASTIIHTHTHTRIAYVYMRCSSILLTVSRISFADRESNHIPHSPLRARTIGRQGYEVNPLGDKILVVTIERQFESISLVVFSFDEFPTVFPTVNYCKHVSAGLACPRMTSDRRTGGACIYERWVSWRRGIRELGCPAAG